MKKILKLSLVTLLAVLAMGVMSYAASGGGKHHKAAKENKKFATVFYQYGGVQPVMQSSDITTQTNWTSVTSNPCDNSGHKLCSIEFDASTTTLTQALALIPVLSSYVEGTVYPTGGGSPSVKIHTMP